MWSLRGGRVHRALFGLVGFWCKGARGGRTQQVRTTLDFLVPWVEACLHRHQMGDEKTGGHLVFKGIIIGLQPCTWCLATCPAGPNIWAAFKLGKCIVHNSLDSRTCNQAHLENGHLDARLGCQAGDGQGDILSSGPFATKFVIGAGLACGTNLDFASWCFHLLAGGVG